MMKRKRKPRRHGVLTFMIPVVALVLAIFFIIVFFAFLQSGTLDVSAYTQNGGVMTPVHVAATVNGRTVVTPANLSRQAGAYTVVFPSVQWYETPPSHTVVLDGGKTAYATGVYVPYGVVIGVSKAGFNQTAVSVEHGLNPVEWYNDGNTIVTINVSSVGRLVLEPGQNFTQVFQSPGVYSYTIYGTNNGGTVSVS